MSFNVSTHFVQQYSTNVQLLLQHGITTSQIEDGIANWPSDNFPCR